MNEIVKLAPSRLPIAAAIAKEFELTPDKWRVLVDQIFPAAKSVEAITMALAYCRARNLDIYKKPVHIVPMWSKALGRKVETVWPGISEIRTTAARTGEYAGIDAVEFGPIILKTFTGKTYKGDTLEKTVSYPEWASVVVYRVIHKQRCAYHAKVFWEETYASIGNTDVPNDMWAKRPRGQLDKCVEAAAIRKAFPEEVGNDYAAEEMEGRVLDHGEPRDITPTPPPAPPAPANMAITPSEPAKKAPGRRKSSSVPYADRARIQAEAEAKARAQDHDPETGEVIEDEVQPLDPDKWLDALEGALVVCTDQESLDEVWDAEAGSVIEGGGVFPPDQAKAKALLEKHTARVERDQN